MWKKLVRFSTGSILPLFVLTTNFCIQTGSQALAAGQPVAATNRPMRDPKRLVLTVGQNLDDLRGRDDKIIQAGVEYLNRLGGGTLHILPGVYEMRNSVFLRPNITLRGSGKKTVLKKAPGVVTPLVRDSDWFEYGVQVRSVEGFEPGGGIMLRSPKGKGDWQFEVLRATVTAIKKDIIYLDRLTGENFWIGRNATAATIFPILTAAENVDDVVVENIVLDGNRNQNEHINGNFAGGVFIQNCNRWRFKKVTSRNYNGEVGILFRREAEEFRCGNRNRIENCVIRDNGGSKPGIGIDIQGKTEDITVRNTKIENTSGRKQKIGIRISAEAERIILRENTFKNCPTKIEDLRKNAASEKQP